MTAALGELLPDAVVDIMADAIRDAGGLEAIEEREAIANAEITDEERHAATVADAVRILEQPDTPRGLHAVARAWLRDNGPTKARAWRRG